jgi:hypothetical protein
MYNYCSLFFVRICFEDLHFDKRLYKLGKHNICHHVHNRQLKIHNVKSCLFKQTLKL